MLVFSIVVHEVAHGWVALRLGDPTARDAGRLTLNPLRHLDPMGSVILPLLLTVTRAGFLFGWAKPVPVDARWFRRPLEGQSWVAAAGPASNLLLAAAGAGLLRAAGSAGDAAYLLGYAGMHLVIVNVVLATFNLLPVPPLDGSWILARLLPENWRRTYLGFGRTGFFVVLVILMTPAKRIVWEPAQVVIGWYLRLAGHP